MEPNDGTFDMADETTITEIYQAINGIPALLAGKGKVEPHATVLIAANEEISILIGWRKPYSPNSWDTESECFRDGAFDVALVNAMQFIADLPSAEQAKLHQFMGALGKVIDGGRDAGIAVDFMNPLLDTMKRLSENVITHQPRAES